VGKGPPQTGNQRRGVLGPGCRGGMLGGARLRRPLTLPGELVFPSLEETDGLWGPIEDFLGRWCVLFIPCSKKVLT
jgi:hypothetical protein